MNEKTTRLVIAGGGLSGSLLALALARLRPDLPILLVEGASGFGGNHTWSFFEPDVDPKARWLIDPLVAAKWDSYDIHFPKRSRTLDTVYQSITSRRLDEAVRSTLRPDQYLLNARIEWLEPERVWLSGGEILEARAVIDALGPSNLPGIQVGWQKFVGREYRLERPHGLSRPIVMDSTVDQIDGYRFVYCLPFSDHELLVEDTYYSLDPRLDVPALGERIQAYLAGRGWEAAEMLREETGILPVATGGSIDQVWDDRPGLPRLGLKGAFFHPTTGYSLPDAVRTAMLVAEGPAFDSESLYRRLRGHSEGLWRKRRFYRLLNRMLFHAAEPDQRYRVLEHFYRLDPGLIARFYAGRSGIVDKLHILSGKPPVPVGRALAALRGKGRSE